MTAEIERKFLIKKLPDLNNIKSIKYERYYIFLENNIELRIQNKNDIYEIERKVIKDKLNAEKSKFLISENEFKHLKKLASKAILRDSYPISNNPNLSIKIYHGEHEGLMRAEVEFKSEKEAKKFEPLDWFGKEITDSEVSRDSKLITMNKESIKSFLKTHQ